MHVEVLKYTFYRFKAVFDPQKKMQRQINLIEIIAEGLRLIDGLLFAGTAKSCREFIRELRTKVESCHPDTLI